MNISTNNPEQCAIATEALKGVIDPEIGLNIVDLGLVYRVEFLQEEKRIALEMTLTTQFCPMGEAITDSACETMQESFKDYTTDVNLVFEPRWGHHLISEEGHEFLNS
jgi:metal-sulfur cluster biosynthetic enzyme